MLARVALRLVGALLLLGAVACESKTIPMVHVVLGATGEERRSFQPKSALADYVEFPGGGAELRITLSSATITCESMLPLEPDQVLVTLTLVAPPGQKLEPKIFPYVAELPPPAEGSAAAGVPPTSVLSYVRLGKVGHTIPPGGQAEITELVLDLQGVVRGNLKLEQPGSSAVAPTSIIGSFSARWCRISADSTHENS